MKDFKFKFSTVKFYFIVLKIFEMLNAQNLQVTSWNFLFLFLLFLKCGESGDGTSKNQRVNIVSSLVRVHRLQIHHMTNDMIFIGDSIATENVATLT